MIEASSSAANEQTPVDDVRRVRRQLTIDAGGDIATIAKRATTVAEQLREKLGLKIVDPPGPASGRENVAG
jgi:hypothetical protein